MCCVLKKEKFSFLVEKTMKKILTSDSVKYLCQILSELDLCECILETLRLSKLNDTGVVKP